MMFIVVMTIYLILTEPFDENKDEQNRISTTIENETTLNTNQMPMTSLIGQSEEELMELYGKPTRIDPSFYGYDWWIYDQNEREYMQIGIQNNTVVTAYIIGEAINIEPFHIEQNISDIFSITTPEPTIAVEYDGNYYRFELSEEDMNIRPLIDMDGVFVQLYLDRYTGKLSSVRMMNAETLIKLRPYEVVYRGELVSPERVNKEQLRMIERGQEKQIFDVTNIIRKRHQLRKLIWDEDTAKVAYGHSKDMSEEHYFSHHSSKHGSLGNRLEKGAVSYELAGENIAAQYIDGLAAVEGWLNSEGHRKMLLEKNFTHIGVGVYNKYYTQNFVKKSKKES